LQQVTVVCRGPKPSAVLRRYGVPITLTAQSPFTTPEVLDVMSGLDLAGAGVALLHYGERNAALAEALQARGARVEDLLLYEWRLPEDTAPLRVLVHEVIAGKVDAIAFTSQVQVRHLFQIASDEGCERELTGALENRIIVASVGPVCTAGLAAYGITPDVIPEHPKMGPMIAALARFVDEHLPAEGPGD
jgi:uroporphyrinogen-III synthase